MIWKEGTSYVGLKLAMRRVLVEADKVWKEFHQELAVTSAVDGTHSASSLHYYGYAVDLRTRYFSASEKTQAATKLRRTLGESYLVLAEDTHIHVQYQPAKGSDI